MQRLGVILHISPSRSAILKIETTPRIGQTVVDENLKPVGEVFDIIGPISSPYAAVKPTIQEPEKLVGKRLYMVSSRGERRR